MGTTHAAEKTSEKKPKTTLHISCRVVEMTNDIYLYI
jgi:hypothetical protein